MDDNYEDNQVPQVPSKRKGNCNVLLISRR
jgi:hypothetical protein